MATLPWGPPTDPNDGTGRDRWAALLNGQTQVQPKRRVMPICPPEKKRNRHTGPRLTKAQAQEARELAAKIGVLRAAARFDVATGSLYRAWRRYKIPTLTGRRYRQRTFSSAHGNDRRNVERMVKYLAEYGPDATAERYGCCRATLYHYLARYNIPPPNGQGNTAPALRR